MSLLNPTTPPDSNAFPGPGPTRRRPRGRTAALVVLVGVVAVLGVACTKNAAAYEVAVRINATRNEQGLRSLALDETLINKAQAWAEQMAANRNVSHSVLTENAGNDWRVLAENVGWARSVAEMHALFMNSAPHRTNILNGRFTRMGTGVAEVDGQYYVVQVFAG